MCSNQPALPEPANAATNDVAEDREPARSHGLQLAILIAAWLLAVGVAILWLDQPAMQWVQSHRLSGHSFLALAWRWPGHFSFTLLLGVSLALVHPRHWRAGFLLACGGRFRAAIASWVPHWRAGLFVVCCGISAGLVYSIGKWIAGRIRPFHDESPLTFHPFINGWQGLLSSKNLCFPSGHSTLAFATAFALALLLPRHRWWFMAAAALVGVERVLEGAHYPGDVLAAVGAGWLAVTFVRPAGRAMEIAGCE